MSAALDVPMAASIELHARGLSHRYGGGRGLAAISFKLEGPGTAAVTGPNGSGKSTLLRALAGLLRPSEGEAALVLEGREVPRTERRHHVGLASPDLAFYEEMTVRENLGFAAAAAGGEDGADARVANALERVELDARSDDRVAALSSGMKQRMRIAFAVLNSPRVLLLDEPGSHLDDAGRAVLTRIVQEARKVALVVVATNDEREWALGDERVQLDGGGLGRPS